MRIFKPSEELAQILLNNGFTETTKKLYPESYSAIKLDGYDSKKMIRFFQKNPNNTIKFQSGEIIIRYKNGYTPIDIKEELSEDELRAAITFFNLPHQTKTTMKRKKEPITELYKTYYNIKSNPIISGLNMAQIRIILRNFEGVLI